MILKSKRFIKGISLCLVASLTLGSFILFKKSSKAAFINENEVVNDNYKKFIQQFRKDGVDITITSLDDLYNEFNNHKNIDELEREDILAKSSDEVIMKFLLEEEKKIYNISGEVVENDIFSDSLEENVEENYKEYIKSVDTEYYKKGEDSYKKVTTLTDKYGGKFEIISTDESENITRGGYTLMTGVTPKNERTYKDYGDRKFTYHVKSMLSEIEAAFGYTLNYGNIVTRYIQGDVINKFSPVEKITIQNETITRSSSNNIGESVSGEVIFIATAAQAIFGGMDICHMKIEMSVLQGADSNHPTKCGMMITQTGLAYIRKG